MIDDTTFARVERFLAQTPMPKPPESAHVAGYTPVSLFTRGHVEATLQVGPADGAKVINAMLELRLIGYVPASRAYGFASTFHAALARARAQRRPEAIDLDKLSADVDASLSEGHETFTVPTPTLRKLLDEVKRLRAEKAQREAEEQERRMDAWGDAFDRGD